MTTSQNEQMIQNRSFAIRRVVAIDAQPMLEHLAETVDSVRQAPRTTRIRVLLISMQCKIFSGHDISLTPLLTALGLKATEPPHYRARLTFEVNAFCLVMHRQVYVRDEESLAIDNLFLRVIYDGVDRTSDVRFCSKDVLLDGFCPAKLFEEFARRGLFEWAGTESRDDLCTVE